MGSRLENRVALVSGGSRGIGLAVAEELAQRGASVAILARSAEDLRLAGQRLRESGALVHEAVLDVTDRSSCFETVASAVEELGAPDILVNAAGIYIPRPFLDYRIEELHSMMNVNFFGAVTLMQAVLPYMQEAGYGRIVNIASTAGKWASTNQSGYNASKHALVGLTRCVATEVGRSGVTVNVICPGIVDTDMLDSLFEAQGALTGRTKDEVLEQSLARLATGKLLEPTEVAALAAYLVSEEAGGMTGQSIVIDGGRLFI